MPVLCQYMEGKSYKLWAYGKVKPKFSFAGGRGQMNMAAFG